VIHNAAFNLAEFLMNNNKCQSDVPCNIETAVNDDCCRITGLPFVTDVSCWNVPETDDYQASYSSGVEFATHLCEFYKHNNWLRGGNTLLEIISDMAPTLHRNAPNRGYAAGFCGQLERMLRCPVESSPHSSGRTPP
jgi:hypothetical protein